jgi:hypothetical protein
VESEGQAGDAQTATESTVSDEEEMLDFDDMVEQKPFPEVGAR